MLLHCQPRVSMLVHTVSSERNGFITVPFARVSECFFISFPRASRLGLLNFCHNTNFVKNICSRDIFIKCLYYKLFADSYMFDVVFINGKVFDPVHHELLLFYQ